MTREIKFRAWNKNRKDWEGNFSITENGSFQRLGIGQNQDFVEIMQYTGLKDKNGKEIYEGDILSPGLREVSWQQGGYSMGDGWYTESHELQTGYWTLSKTQTEDAEIIGNIYENKDFLS